MPPFRLPQEMKAEFGNDPLRHRRAGFKFCTSGTVEHILRGRVRIGSLAKFRRLESASLVDGSEGTISQFVIDDVDYFETHPNSTVRGIVHQRNEGQITIANCLFEHVFDFPAFCFTYDFNEEAYRSLCDADNQYDRCVEIQNLRSFANIVAKRLSAGRTPNIPTGYLCLPVHYGGNLLTDVRDDPGTSIRRAFMKSKKFAPNKEGRMVFFEEGRETAGYRGVTFRNGDIFDIPELRPLLREVTIPKEWKSP